MVNNSKLILSVALELTRYSLPHRSYARGAHIFPYGEDIVVYIISLDTEGELNSTRNDLFPPADFEIWFITTRSSVPWPMWSRSWWQGMVPRDFLGWSNSVAYQLKQKSWCFYDITIRIQFGIQVASWWIARAKMGWESNMGFTVGLVRMSCQDLSPEPGVLRSTCIVYGTQAFVRVLHYHNRITPLLDSDASRAKWSAATYEEAKRIAQANDIFASEYDNDCTSYGTVSGDHQASSSTHYDMFPWAKLT